MKPLDCLELYEDAEFYDAEFASRDLEIPFYRKYAQCSNGPVLEVACGTGRLTLPIARDGVDMTGLDVSRPMLEQARRKSAAEGLDIEWVEQDCRDISLPRKFGLVFSATNAMQHLLDRESALAFLRSAGNVLRPEGQLVLDVFNPNPAKLNRPAGERHFHKNIQSPDGGEIRVEVASGYDAETRILHFDLFYLNQGNLLRTKHVNMRCFFPDELSELCEASQLEIIHRFGDYDESPFSSTSPKQILICRKIGHRKHVPLEVQLVFCESRDYADFEEVVADLKRTLGEGVESAMQNWCGVKVKPTRPPWWQVWLVRDPNGNTVGLTGLYTSASNRIWIGWSGVRSNLRRVGLGSQIVRELARRAHDLRYKQLHVYTDDAAGFYQNNGFTLLGPSEVHAPRETPLQTDIVLVRDL